MKKKKLKEKIKRLQLQNDMHKQCFEDCQTDWSDLQSKNTQLNAKKEELENQLFEAQELINGKLKEIKELIESKLPVWKPTLSSLSDDIKAIINPAPPVADLDLMLPSYDEIVPKKQRSPEEERILCEQEHATVLPREMG